MIELERCIFCLKTDAKFTKVEHIIPESLGGEEVLPRGFVCDDCNQYFGTKVEKDALSIPIISYMRAWLSQPSKKGKHHLHEGHNFAIIGSDDGWPLFSFAPKKYERVLDGTGRFFIIPALVTGSFVRLLLKSGLELLANNYEFDVYSSEFDEARKIARFPAKGAVWPFGYTHLDLKDTIEAEGEDSEGWYQIRLVYQFSIAQDLESKVIMFAFLYGHYVFLIPLTNRHYPLIVKLSGEKTGMDYDVALEKVTVA
jgi:hypothetical protein